MTVGRSSFFSCSSATNQLSSNVRPPTFSFSGHALFKRPPFFFQINALYLSSVHGWRYSFPLPPSYRRPVVAACLLGSTPSFFFHDNAPSHYHCPFRPFPPITRRLFYGKKQTTEAPPSLLRRVRATTPRRTPFPFFHAAFPFLASFPSHSGAERSQMELRSPLSPGKFGWDRSTFVFAHSLSLNPPLKTSLSFLDSKTSPRRSTQIFSLTSMQPAYPFNPTPSRF